MFASATMSSGANQLVFNVETTQLQPFCTFAESLHELRIRIIEFMWFVMGWFADEYQMHESGDVDVQVRMFSESGNPYTSKAYFKWPGPKQLFVSFRNSSCLDAKRYFQHRILELCPRNITCSFQISSAQFSHLNVFDFYSIMPNTSYPLIPMAANLRTLVNQFLDDVPQTLMEPMVFPALDLPRLPVVVNPLVSSDQRCRVPWEEESSDEDEQPGPARSTQPGPAPTPRNKNKGADGGGGKRKRQTPRNKNDGKH